MSPMPDLKTLNAPPPPQAPALWQHFSDTYLSIRLGLAILAFTFPIVLWGWGLLVHGLELQPSMSAYFWAAARGTECASFPMRSIFVGVLVAIGAALYVYKGLTDLENYLLNLAAVCAVAVALVPERLGKDDPYPRVQQLFERCPAIRQWAIGEQPGLPYHYLAAVGLFVLLFIVAWFCAAKSLDYLPPDAPWKKERFKSLYRGIALSMPVVGAIMGFIVWSLRDRQTSAVFYLEMFEIWIFAAYWGVKTYEMSLTKLEKDPHQAVANAAAAGTTAKIEREAAGAPPT